MIRQGLLRQSRSLISPVPSRSMSQLHSPFRLRHLQPVSSAFAKPFPPRLERRWISAETDAEAKTNPDPESVSTRGDASDQQTQAEDPLKKELEAKNREIIDLKVCHTSTRIHFYRFAAGILHRYHQHCRTLWLTYSLSFRTDTSAPSPTSATFKNVPSVMSSLHATSLSSALPVTLSSR